MEIDLIRASRGQSTDEKKPRIAGFLLKLVGERGFEPPTHWSQTSCATKLRYSPMSCILLLFDANCII